MPKACGASWGPIFAGRCSVTAPISSPFIERAGGKRPGCWGHGRRRLVEAAKGGDVVARQGVRTIARLFQIEKASTLAGDTAEQRRTRREKESAPVLEELRTWRDKQLERTPPRTPLGEALGYLRRQWIGSCSFLTTATSS